jgi:hypothetical protein
MKWAALESKMLSAAAYDDSQQILYLRFRNGNARSSVENNDSRVTPLYDAFLRLTTAALDGLRVFNSSMRTGISL